MRRASRQKIVLLRDILVTELAFMRGHVDEQSEGKQPADDRGRDDERSDGVVAEEPHDGALKPSRVASALLAHDENRKRIRQRGSSAAAVRRCWTELRRDQQNVIRLRVQRERSRARHRLNRLFHGEARRTVFFDDRQGTIHLRAERFHRIGVEGGTVHAAADRDGCGNLAGLIIGDRHYATAASAE